MCMNKRLRPDAAGGAEVIWRLHAVHPYSSGDAVIGIRFGCSKVPIEVAEEIAKELYVYATENSIDS